MRILGRCKYPPKVASLIAVALALLTFGAPLHGEEPEVSDEPEVIDEPEALIDQYGMDPADMAMGVGRQPTGLWFLPIVNYISDIGVGYGALVTYRPEVAEGVPEQGYRALTAFSTKKAQLHSLGWERMPGARGVHVLVRGMVNRTFYSNYFGIGNGVDPTPPSYNPLNSPEAYTLSENTANDFYTRFTLTYSEASAMGQVPLSLREGARAFGVTRFRYVGVAPFTQERIEEDTGVPLDDDYTTLLEEEAPNGIDGGAGGQLQLGFMIDSRDRPVSPHTGTFHQFSLRGDVYGSASEGSSPLYGGVNITLQRYYNLWDRGVLANRLVGDFGFGDVPFWDLATFGAAVPYSGLGGTLAGRGLLLRHYVGKVKILWGPEIRLNTYTTQVRGQSVEFSTALFAESGRVWAEYERDGTGPALHSALGAGLRVVWAQRLLVRLDVARSITDDDPTGVYLVFGHPY